MTMTEWQSQPYGLVFPGQGAQFVGMGAALIEASPAAAKAVTEADAVLDFALSRLMANGPADELEDTFNAQPAILAVSVAAMKAVEAASGNPLPPAVVAGHSLGEFSALVAAGAISYTDALRLVRERGRIMKAAGTTNPGAMAAVLGLDDDALAAVCEEASGDGVVVVANRYCPGQTVISGDVAARARASELAKERGAKRVARLGVSIASHSPLMAEAAREFGILVGKTTLGDPRVPVVANGSAKPMTTRDQVIAEISAQMAAPVDWTGSVETMIAAGVRTFIELGPGSVIAGLIKRIDRDATVLGLNDLGLDLPSTAK
jgi:[acyl-carrier-protein] S-malonyltransferase